jgi:hypothetical protein
MHIFKCFENQSDTYHDTRTHYLMEQDPFLLQDQADVMDVVVADKVEALKKKRMGPPGPCSSRSGSRYSMSRTCGPRDIISLVIPRLGDNRETSPWGSIPQVSSSKETSVSLWDYVARAWSEAGAF